MTPAGAATAPKYYRVKEGVLRMIDGAEVGAPVPTERALALQFDTSRTTVRQALAELVAEGRLERTQGKGTFVAPPKLSVVRQLTSFSEDAAAQGRQTASRVLSCTQVPLDEEDALLVGRRAGERVTRLERIRFLDGDPLALEIALLPTRLPRLRQQLERRGSLYRTLQEAYGLRIIEVEDTVETGLADPVQSRLLELEVGAPLLLVRRVARGADGAVVELTRSAFRGDRFRFVARRAITD